MTPGLLQLAIIVCVAAVLGIAAKLLKQPTVLAYLVTGIAVALLGYFNLADRSVFQVFSDLGIMFLLFLIGLEINYASLTLVGRTAAIAGLAQVVVTAAIGFGIAVWMHFPFVAAAYIALALTFSSTVIVVKLLSDKRDLSSLYGKISVGVLLVQDVVAVLVLIGLAGVESGGSVAWAGLALALAKGAALAAAMLWLGRKILPAIFDRIARSQELLFLTSLAWLFLVAAAASAIGFSIEIAGLLAGLALANSVEHFEIANKIRPLRDFFILIFFVILGSSIVLSNFKGLALPIVVFSLFVLVGNPLVVLVVLGLMGHRKRTSFLAGISIAQVSEFSLVLVALGVQLGQIGGDVLTIVTAVAIVTITLSTYLIMYGDELFAKFSGVLSIFERENVREIEEFEEGIRRPFVLVGCGRTGESIAVSLPKEKLLIVDMDPDVARKFRARGYAFIFGDVSDDEVFASAHIDEAKLVVSTSPVLEHNLSLLDRLSPRDPRPKLVLRAETETDAKLLYDRGADYVLLPNFTSGQYLGRTIVLNPAMSILKELKENDLALMRKIDG